jgi:ADP-ribose pyrophosphatase YjhB (NUDIX family)
MKYVHPKINAAGVLPISKATGRILLNRRGFQQPDPGVWDCFAGRMDRTETSPKETAIREFREESCYGGEFQISKTPFYIYDTNHVKFFMYLCVVPDEFIPDLVPARESIDAQWFPCELEYFPEELHPGFREMLECKFDELQHIVYKVSDCVKDEVETIVFVIEL